MIASKRALPLALLCIVACGACFAFLPSEAHAAGDKPLSATAMAEALFKEGKRLLKEGKVAEACRKLEGSYRIDPAPGTLLNLALCHEEEGKTATAWGELTESRELAKKAKRADRLKLAEDHIRALEPKLSRFVVAVPKEAVVKDMVVEVDAVPLDPGAWGTAIPIDPGEHEAIAKAPKFKNWQTRFQVEVGKTATVLVPALVRKPDPLPPGASSRWKKPVGFSMLGLSAVLFGVGGYFGVKAISAGTDVAANCDKMICDVSSWQTLSDGRTAATISNILFSVGAVSAGAGLFFVLTAPKPDDEASAEASLSGNALWIRPSISVGVLPFGATIDVGGVF